LGLDLPWGSQVEKPATALLAQKIAARQLVANVRLRRANKKKGRLGVFTGFIVP
jgi:hypothetical protein